MRKLLDLPEEGPDRLAFYQDYLEHEDPLLAQDSYDEFARAPYDTVIGLKDRMQHDKLVEWIHDVELAPSRRRLYLTMLGVCGNESDLLRPFRFSRFAEGKLHPTSHSPFPWS